MFPSLFEKQLHLLDVILHGLLLRAHHDGVLARKHKAEIKSEDSGNATNGIERPTQPSHIIGGKL